MPVLKQIGNNIKENAKDMSAFDWLDKAGSATSLLANGFSLGSAFVEDEKISGALGITGGALSTLSGMEEFASSINSRVELSKGVDKSQLTPEQRKARRGKKASAYLGMTNGTLGTLGGVADIISGAGSVTGNKSLSKWGGVASGIIGTLGGITGTAKGITDLWTIHKERKIKENELKNAKKFKESVDEINRLEQEKENAKNAKEAEDIQKKIDVELGKNTEYKKMREQISKLKEEEKNATSDRKKKKINKKIERIEKEIQRKGNEKDIQKEIDDLKLSRGSAINGIVGSVGSGIGSLIGAFGAGFDNDAAKKAGKAGAAIGNGIGGLSSLFGTFGLDGSIAKLFRRDKNTPQPSTP